MIYLKLSILSIDNKIAKKTIQNNKWQVKPKLFKSKSQQYQKC